MTFMALIKFIQSFERIQSVRKQNSYGLIWSFYCVFWVISSLKQLNASLYVKKNMEKLNSIDKKSAL